MSNGQTILCLTGWRGRCLFFALPARKFNDEFRDHVPSQEVTLISRQQCYQVVVDDSNERGQICIKRPEQNYKRFPRAGKAAP